VPRENTTAVTTIVPAETTPLRLLIVGRAAVTSVVLPGAGRVAIGRAAECEVHIGDHSISRNHAVLELDPPLRIVDAGSVNGTWIAERRIAAHEPVGIELEQAVRLGSVTIILQRERPRSAEAVVSDDRMTALHKLVSQVAAADINVLLYGETGVGKEVFAEAIHRQSSRADGPMLKLNCAALSEGLLESELFGHERGSFTGAVETKPGLLEVAEGGVVFLDEIGELLPSIQAKLLRVLDDRMVLRVGGTTPRPFDVRIMSATNRDLDAEVRRGAFRLDLLYRLNAMSIVIPPLRERISEIVPLANTFLAEMAARLDRPVPRLTDDAIALLWMYRWPGNVRELRNVIERALVLSASDVIDACDLPEDQMRAMPVPHDPTPEERERQRILDALARCHGNQTHAAELLGIARRTLINKLDKFALPRPRKRGPTER